MGDTRNLRSTIQPELTGRRGGALDQAMGKGKRRGAEGDGGIWLQSLSRGEGGGASDRGLHVLFSSAEIGRAHV